MPVAEAEVAGITEQQLAEAQVIAMRYARRKQPEHCEDIVQDVLIQAWQTFHTFNPQRGTFAGWIRVIAQTHCGRARERSLRLMRECQLDSMDVAVEATRAIPIGVRLPEMSASDQAIVQCLLSGYSESEAAERLGLTRRIVHYRLTRISRAGR